MNVLFLSHRLPYAPNRGDRIRAFHLLREISRWAQVDVVSLVHDADEAAHADTLRSLVSSVRVAHVHKLPNAARSVAGLLTGTAATHTMLTAPSAQSAIEAAVGARRPDVVFSFNTGVAPLALRSPLQAIPLVLDMCDVDSEKWAELAPKARWPMSAIYAREARLLRAFEARVSVRATATLVVNAKEHATLAAIAPGARIHTVENGVDVSSFHPPAGPSVEPVVVFCGVMNYAPNIEGATWMSREVWPIVQRSRPDARLVLVGSNPAPVVRALNDPARGITVTGAVPEVQPYLWAAAVAVAPMHTARGLQNKVLEAVAAGLPAVVTSAVHRGLPAEVHPACEAADTAEAFAGAILTRLNEAPQVRRELAARANLARLGWSERLSNLQSILTEAAALPPDLPRGVAGRP